MEAGVGLRGLQGSSLAFCSSSKPHMPAALALPVAASSSIKVGNELAT